MKHIAFLTLLLSSMVATCWGDSSTDFVLIPAGPFVMGATTNIGHESYGGETPQHTVTLSAFYAEKYEVTKSLWDDVAMWASGHGYDISASSSSARGQTHPVYAVSWYECVKWCNARSEKSGLTPCYTNNAGVYRTGNDSNVVCNWSANGYRLPTEAEWEKASRGGAPDHRFTWTDSETIQHSRANYNSSATYSYDTSPTRGYHPTFAGGTSPVGYFAPNGYGLYDMVGNVSEWCWDWYSSSYYATSPSVDPRGATTGAFRSIRNVSWFYSAKDGRCAARNYNTPTDDTGHADGFRCVRSTAAPGGALYEQPVSRVPEPSPPTQEPEYDSLVIVTHGYQAGGALANATWIDDLGDDIRARLLSTGKANWLVYPFHWETFAWPTPKMALLNGEQIGSLLGRRIGNQDWQHVHLIGHSAGSALIQAAAERIRSASPSIVIHTTFLDPFLSYTTLERLSYGQYSDWSDSYFSQDALTSYTTRGKLSHAFNVDVTGLDPDYTPLLLFSGTAGSTPAVQTRSSTSHGWPYEFYANTVPPMSQQGSMGLGFPLSKEGDGWDNHGRYTINNDPVVLGNLNPLPVTPLQLTMGNPVDLTQTPISTSIAGATVVGADRCELIVSAASFSPSFTKPRTLGAFPSGLGSDVSNAWISVSVLVTQLADFVAFDIDFTSGALSEGLLTVYWNTNVIGSLDERAAHVGAEHYRLSLLDTAQPGIHALGFRLDAFTNESTSVTITNIVTGYAGDTNPFGLTIATLTDPPQLSLIAPSNATYLAYSSSNLVQWSLFGILNNTNGTVAFHEPAASNATIRFYRATRPINE